MTLRRLLIATTLAFLAAAAPAAAHERDSTRPLLFVSGSESGDTVNCRGTWKPFEDALVDNAPFVAGDHVKFVGGVATLSFREDDENCDGVLVPDSNTVQGQARALARYISTVNGQLDEPVDVVAHGTAGVALRYAVAMSGTPGWPAKVRVEDAITLGSPHGGSKRVVADCDEAACQQLDPDGTFVKDVLTQAELDAPQGEGGTDWTVIGSAHDTIVDGSSATAMPGAHRTIYKDTRGQHIRHPDLLTDVRKKKDARITYTHPGRETTDWNAAPHVATRVINALIAVDSDGAGGGNQQGCSGYNDGDGPTTASSNGLAVWPGDDNQDLSYVKVGIVEAYANCFVKVGDKRFESTGVVRINGLDLIPTGNKKIAIDIEQMKITSEEASVYLPTARYGQVPIPLRQNTGISWRIPPTGGAVSGNESDLFTLEGDTELGSLKLKGSFKLSMEQAKVVVETSASLPGAFIGKAPPVPQCGNGKDDDLDGKTDTADDDCDDASDPYENVKDGPGLTVKLSSSNLDGVQFSKVAFQLDGAANIGRLHIRAGARFSYDWDTDTLTAGLTVILPMPGEPELTADYTQQDGHFKSVVAQIDNMNVKLPYGLYLQRVKLGVAVDPLTISLGAGISLGPSWVTTVGPRQGLRIDANIDISRLGLHLDGTFKVLGTEWGSANLDYVDGSGVTMKTKIGKTFEFKGKYGQFDARIQGESNGAFDSKTYDQSGLVEVCFGGELKVGTTFTFDPRCLAKGEVRVSIRETQAALSACGGIDLRPFWDGRIGGGWRQRITDHGLEEKTETMAGACDVNKWHEQAAGARAAQAATGELTLGAVPAAMIAVRGDGKPPHVAVHGPDGQELPAPAAAEGVVRSGRFALIHFPGDATTYVMIAKPAPGRWRIEAMPGSAPLKAIETADALPEAQVQGSVRRVHKRVRELRYRVKPIEGQRVMLVEQGPDVHRTLGRARDGKGTLRFRPAYGPGGTRRIVALVEQNGMPRTKLTVARYHAEPPPPVRRPRNIRMRRRGSRLTVSWAPVAGAAGYVAYVRAPEGRLIRFDVRGKPRFTVRLLSRRGVKIELRAVRRNLTEGPATHVRGGKAKARKKPKRGRR